MTESELARKIDALFENPAQRIRAEINRLLNSQIRTSPHHTIRSLTFRIRGPVREVDDTQIDIQHYISDEENPNPVVIFSGTTLEVMAWLKSQ